MRMFSFHELFVCLFAGTVAVATGSEALAQGYYRSSPGGPVIRTPPSAPSRGAIVGSAVQQGYNFSQQGQQIRQWQQDQRQTWQLDDRLKQQWLQQQQQRNAIQQQQQRSFIGATANSTPMYIAPAPQAVQQQRAQQWGQQYQSRQQTLQRWQMQPLSR
jgi:hypothetical protein